MILLDANVLLYAYMAPRDQRVAFRCAASEAAY